MDQDVPFHCSPKTDGVLPMKAVPSASQRLMAMHEIELRYEKSAPAGTGTVTWDHVEPFQTNEMAPGLSLPTAAQNEEPRQDTEVKLSEAPAGTETLGTTLQVEPFHCSARTPPPVDSFCSPTATQSDDVEQDTALSWLCADPAAALAFVQLLALTNGGLVNPAPAGADASPPTVRATSVPAAAIRNVRNLFTATTSSATPVASPAETVMGQGAPCWESTEVGLSYS